MKTIPLVLAVVAALAAAAFGWQTHKELGEAREALAQSQAQLQKAQGDLRAAVAEVAPLRKETAELKAAIEQQRAELGSAKAFLEAERATTLRVREELALAKQQMASAGRPRSAPQPSPAYVDRWVDRIEIVRPAPPTVIRAAPGSAPAAQGQAVRAQ